VVVIAYQVCETIFSAATLSSSNSLVNLDSMVVIIVVGPRRSDVVSVDVGTCRRRASCDFAIGRSVVVVGLYPGIIETDVAAIVVVEYVVIVEPWLTGVVHSVRIRCDFLKRFVDSNKIARISKTQ
jgi:hypothetical protein